MTMAEKSAKDLVIAGYGNVATHLARALKGRVAAIAGRDLAKCEALANEIDAEACSFEDIAGYSPSTVLISVADNAIDTIIDAIGYLPGNPLVIHTSGSVPKEKLSKISERTGVLYPLQTFSKATPLDVSTIPFFTEATCEEDLDKIDTLAKSISPKVYHADGNDRGYLHIAGVFSSNFINAMLQITEKVLAERGYGLDTVRPLVEIAIAKAFDTNPFAAQTGPALRGDKAVMQLHQSKLPEAESEIYGLISDYIIKTHNTELK